MSKLIIVPMTKAHYLEAAKYAPAWVDNEIAAQQHLAPGSDAFAGLIDDRLAAVAGVMKLWAGTGEAWAILTDLGRARPMLVHRAVRDGVKIIMAERRYVRIQADVYHHFEAGRIWALRLGFRKESLMRRYAPDGSDMVRYVWLS